MSYERNGGKLHGNISQNGYGNVIIGRYGGYFEEGYMVGLMRQRKLHGTREASNDGRVRVRIIHGLNISHKELTYLLQKSTGHQKPSITRMILGGYIGRKRPSLVPDRHS